MGTPEVTADEETQEHSKSVRGNSLEMGPEFHTLASESPESTLSIDRRSMEASFGRQMAKPQYPEKDGDNIHLDCCEGQGHTEQDLYYHPTLHTHTSADAHLHIPRPWIHVRLCIWVWAYTAT